MVKALENFLQRTENAPMTFRGWVAGFAGIIAVRIFLENIAEMGPSKLFSADVPTLVHYYLFYIGMLLTFTLITRIFVKDVLPTLRAFLFALVITWLPPLVDFIFSPGKRGGLSYLFQSPRSLLHTFFSFFTNGTSGVTIGLATEIRFVVLGFGLYVAYKTKSFLKGFFGAVLAYAAFFFWGSVPSLFKAICDIFSPVSRGQSALSFFYLNARLSVIPKNFIEPGIQLAPLRELELFFNVAISHIDFILVCFLAFAVAWVLRKKELIAVIKNSRPERAVHYFLALGLGMTVALHSSQTSFSFHWLNVTSVFILALSYYFAGMFAVGVNDLEDVAVDTVSNGHRPLVAGKLDEASLKDFNLFFLIFSLLGGFLVGHYAFYMIVLFTAVYYIYSAPPTRLKSFPLVSTFLISLAFLSAFVAGFYLLSPDLGVHALPLKYVVLFVVFTTLSATGKDLKDIEGDRAAGIGTLPVIFGEKRGKQIIGALLCLAFALVPFILGIPSFFIPSLLAGIAAYFFVVADYGEKYLFALYFAYVALLLYFYSIPL